MTTPHDVLFKELFADPGETAGELRAVLPPELVARIDWATLRRLPANLPDPTDAEQRADLLFAVQIEGRELLLQVVLEHKSREERWTGLQLLGYAVRIWQRHRREEPGSTSLPPVIGVVVHHGPRGWRGSTEFVDLFDLDDGLRVMLEPYLPRQRFLLDDLTHVSAAELDSRAVSAVTRLGLRCLLEVMRGGDAAAVLRALGALVSSVLAEPTAGGRLVAVWRYLTRIWELRPEDLRAVVRREFGRDAERTMASTFDQLVNQGRAEGRADVLVVLLRTRFGALDPADEARVHGATPEELLTWCRRVLTASTVAEVFGDR